MEVDDVAAGMKELDMDNYDEEDDGTFCFCLALWCLFCCFMLLLLCWT